MSEGGNRTVSTLVYQARADEGPMCLAHSHALTGLWFSCVVAQLVVDADGKLADWPLKRDTAAAASAAEMENMGQQILS